MHCPWWVGLVCSVSLRWELGNFLWELRTHTNIHLWTLPCIPCLNKPGASEDLTQDDGVSIILYLWRSIVSKLFKLNLTTYVLFHRKWMFLTVKMHLIVMTLLIPTIVWVLYCITEDLWQTETKLFQAKSHKIMFSFTEIGSFWQWRCIW